MPGLQREPSLALAEFEGAEPQPGGQVAALWRYPVSSMAGERLDFAPVQHSGVVGDRIWGVVDASSERIASPGREKNFIKVPHGHARFRGTGVEVSSDGRDWAAPDDKGVLDALSALFGFPASLRPFQPAGEAGFRPRYEHAPIHLITTAAMRTLQRALPESVIDERRFRPNILVELPDGPEPIPENGWIGREIRIGDLVLRGREPCGRCGFITIEQDGLPLDVEVLRTIVRQHSRNFGIYCDVISPGEIRTGDVLAIGGREA
jgi:uncharacterized protein YcbX